VNFEHLVWKANTLAKVALVPFINRFPKYGQIVELNLIEVWDYLMTIAMTGVAAQARDILSDPLSRQELKRSLCDKLQGGAEGFDDYYKYTVLRTEKVEAPWSGVSAMWVADNLRFHSKGNAVLKQNARDLDFINHISAFMNMSFGSTEVGLPQYLVMMGLEVEKDMGIDMGLATKETKKDSVKKVQILAELFESFAREMVELTAGKEQ
jgi:hypothetical protein